MTPEQYLDQILTHAINVTAQAVTKQTDYHIYITPATVETTKFDIENGTATTNLVWHITPEDTPADAFNIPTMLDLEIDYEGDARGLRVADIHVVARSGCDIEIAGVTTFVSGEEYTDPESAGQPLDLFNYVNHQAAIAGDLWATASNMPRL